MLMALLEWYECVEMKRKHLCSVYKVKLEEYKVNVISAFGTL
jgi:hypothetical protein